MKIVNVIGACLIGGAEILVRDTLINLKKKNSNLNIQLWVMTNIKDTLNKNMLNNVQISKINFENKYVKDLEKFGINVIFLNKRPGKDSVKTWLKIRKLYNEFKPKIIHAHLESVTLNTVIGLLGKRAKIFQTIHSTKVEYPKIQNFFLDILIIKFISISDEVTEGIKKIGIKNEKIIKIENGVNLKKFKFEKREINEWSENIIAVGRLTEAKHYQMMLKAYSIFKERLLQEGKKIPVLKIVGEGEKRYEIETLIKKLNLKNDVLLLGMRQDIPQLLKKADLYLMTSNWEGLSISLIEATASGLPIIATDVGSNNKIIEDKKNGFLIEPNDEINFAKQLFELSGDKKRREKMSREAVKKSQKFDLQEKIYEILNVYEIELR